MAQPGTLVPFLIEVVNHGPTLAPAVMITDTLPAGFIYQQTDNRCRLEGDRLVICTLGTLAVDERVNLTIFTTVSREIAHGTHRNVIVTDSDELYDPTPENNGDGTDISVINTPTAVEQVTFLALARPDHVQLQWLVPPTNQGVRFYIWRGMDGNRAQAVQLTATPIVAMGNPSGAEFAFTDAEILSGLSYTYWLDAVNADGSVQTHGPIIVAVPAQVYELYLPLIQRNHE